MAGGRRRPVFDDRSRFLDRFGLLVLVTVASIVILSLVDIGPRVSASSGRWEAALASILVGATLLLALRASGLARRFQLVADAVVLVVITIVVVIALVSTVVPGVDIPPEAAPMMVVLLSVLAPVAVIRRLLQHRDVTRATLLGAISGYLLIPIAFFYVFLTTTGVDRVPFFGSPEPTTSYMYFSLATVTTTGYGDLTAASDVGRLLSVAEAVTGQMYLVTFVAMLVGLYAASRLARRPSAPVPTEDDTAA